MPERWGRRGVPFLDLLSTGNRRRLPPARCRREKPEWVAYCSTEPLHWVVRTCTDSKASYLILSTCWPCQPRALSYHFQYSYCLSKRGRYAKQDGWTLSLVGSPVWSSNQLVMADSLCMPTIGLGQALAWTSSRPCHQIELSTNKEHTLLC